jgi:hypothetical protein
MFYFKTPCPVCLAGEVGFLRLADQRLLLFCNECDATWRSPHEVGVEPHFLQPTDSSVRWATLAEIAASNWSEFVTGECRD